MQQPVLQQVLQEVITQLTACHVRYMLSGSVAMSIYATPRFTRDLDIVVAIDAVAVDKLSMLWADQYYYTLSSIKEDIYQQRLFNIIHLETMHKIDFIVLKDDVFEQTKFERRRLSAFMGIHLWVIAPEDLILSKLQWIQDYESEIHKKDIINLLTIPNLDRNYLKTWLQHLQLNTYHLPL